MSLTGPGPVSVDREGKVYSGPDAESQAQAREKQIDSRYWTTQKNTAAPAKEKKKTEGWVQSTIKNSPPVFGAKVAQAAVKGAPGAARATWHTLFGG